MTTSVKGCRSGMALLFTLILTMVATIVIGAVVGYVGWAARETRRALAKDRCRLIAQSAVEMAKDEIQAGFNNYVASNFAKIKFIPGRNGRSPGYDWFDVINGRTVGKTSPITIFGDYESYPVVVDIEDDSGSGKSHRYRIWAAAYKDDSAGSGDVIVRVVATAVGEESGIAVSSTVQERVCFGTGQSRVFDNAYFVNNYGWMSGSFTINGEFRANGNVSLKNGAVVNGFIYAAKNDYIGAPGTVTISSSSIYNQSSYRSKSSTTTRSRYDRYNLDELGSYDPATATGTITKPTYYADGITVKSGSKASLSGEAIVHEGTDAAARYANYSQPVEMPFVSDLDPYVDFASESHGTLSFPSATYTDVGGTVRGTPAGTVNAHYTGAGPSGDATLGDKGSLLLIGTSSNPIRIDGPVVVDGDIIIKGYVTGQGTIYAGRNIHIIGDIKYKNEPTWTHSKSGTSAKDEQTSNDTKDMLGLVAKGNIVIGDATSSSICNTISGVSEPYECDASDAMIGYSAKFDGDYSKVEATGGKRKVTVNKVATGSHTETYQEYNSWTRRYETKTRTVTDYAYVPGDLTNRRYWQTACDDKAISDNRATISQIDAVMYNNHAVFGNLGSNFRINGALVCRDEGLSASGGTFNWDMRLRRKKDSEVVKKLGLPPGPDEPYTEGWMEIPDMANTLYTNMVATAEADGD